MARFLKINRSVFNEKHWSTNDRSKGILIDSEEFPGCLKYVIKEDSLILLSGSNGVFAVDLDVGSRLTGEMDEVIDCFVRS
jgi:hypothetical protein